MNNIKITQISSAYHPNDDEHYVYGLCEDNKIYYWDVEVAKWFLFQK